MKTLYIIKGPRKSGKTTLANKLVGEHNVKEDTYDFSNPDPHDIAITELFPTYEQLAPLIKKAKDKGYVVQILSVSLYS